MSESPTSNLEKILGGGQASINEAEYVPGTIHLFDVQHTLNVSHSTANKNLILQPQPSANPNDPLRWSQKKKNYQFTLTWIWAFFAAVTVQWTGPVWTEWTVTFNTSFSRLNVASALVFIGLGFGCIFFQPTAMKRGRRGMYLFCTVLAFIANIIGSQAKSLSYIFVAFLLAGFSAAPCDSLVPISSTDVFFIHERAKYISFLILALYAGSFLAPVVSGYMPSWKWSYYLQVIIFAVLFVILFFLLEDTTFERSFESTEKDILEQIKSHETVLEATKSGVVSEEQVLKSGHRVRSIVTGRNSSNDEESQQDSESIDFSIPKRSYRQKLGVWETEFSDKRSWLAIFSRPFLLITFPALIWGGIVYGAQMMWLSLLATTQSQVYTGGYGFSNSGTGLTNLAPLAGSIVGMFYGGPFVDWLAVKLAKRNNGILEPEFRLWAMIVPTVLNAAGLLAYGLASHNQAPWPITVVLGQALLGFSMSSSGPICLTYAADSYEMLASEGMVLMLFVRNMIGCGFTFAIQPWLDQNGLVKVTWAMFAISVVVNGSFLFMIYFGKSFRRWTKERYYKLSDPNYIGL